MTGPAPAASDAGAPPGPPTRVALAPRLLRVGWLTLVWVLLWGTFSWANLLGGLAVAAVVLVALPLPPVPAGHRPRPGRLLGVAGSVALDLLRSSVQVAWLSVRPGPPPRSSVVEIRLESRSELLVAVLVEVLSLVPGSVVIDVEPEEGRLSAHVLGADDDAAVDAFRARVAALETRLVAAGLGTGPTGVRAEDAP